MFARSWRIAAAFAAGCVGWGREGRPHASLEIAGLDGNDNCNGDCLGKKRGWTREKERGNLKMGLFFQSVFFCYCFLAFLFQCRSIDFLSRSSQLLDGLLLQDFSFSGSNLVVEVLFIKFKSTVYWWSLARFLFQSSKFGHYISVWQLWCGSQLSQIVVFSIDTRQDYDFFKVVPPHLILIAWICVCIIIGSLDWVIEALRQINWFLIKFKSTVCWLSLAWDFSFSHPNLVIIFLFGNYSVRVDCRK